MHKALLFFYLLLLRHFLKKKNDFKSASPTMKKLVILSAICAVFFTQCKKNEDPFLIKEGTIGKLTPNTKIKQLDSIFASDSLVKLSASPNAIETQGEVEIYEKGGKLLLLLSPKDETNPNSTIADILIHDSRYKTENGLTSASTFKDFKEHYKIKSIDRMLNSVLVNFEDTDVYIVIDAGQLTPEVRSDRSAKVEASHIFETAPVKYLRVDWAGKE